MGGRSKRSTRSSSRKSTRGRPNSSADLDETGQHIIAEEGGNDLNADHVTSDSDASAQEVKEGLSHPAAPMGEMMTSKRKRRAPFHLEEGERANDPIEPASPMRARSTRETMSRDNKDYSSASKDAKKESHHISKSEPPLESMPLEMQPSCAAESNDASLEQTRREDLDLQHNSDEETSHHTSDLQVVECSTADEGGTLNSPTIVNTTVKTIEARSVRHETPTLSDKNINGEQGEPPPDEKRDSSSPPLTLDESDCNVNTTKSDGLKYKQSNKPTSIGAANDANATNVPNVINAGDSRKIGPRNVTSSEPQTKNDESRNDAQLEKHSEKIKAIPMTNGEDPTVTSSILGLSGSIKTFAVAGQEANLSVPDSVNASSKLRALSSCSIGEGSQKLSWLADEENDTLVAEANINVEPLGGVNGRAREESQAETKTSAHVYSRQTEGVTFEFPQLKHSKKQTPSINQLKMALFLESSRVHRDTDGNRAFAKYWESISRFITLASHATGLSRSSVGIDDTFTSFLTTKKLKILHNKLILAMISESIGIEVSSRHISKHLPIAWKAKTVELQTPSISTANRFDGVSQQWRELLGRHSGAWTKYSKDITERKPHFKAIPNLQKLSNIHHSIENELTPSARIPATLQIDPFARRHAAKVGLRVSENAVWMMVVAVQEYMKMVIQKTIATANELSEGYIPEQPKTNTEALVCQPKKSKSAVSLRSEAKSASVEELNSKEHLIGAAELSLMLASCPLIAGRDSSSRMALLRSSVLEMREVGHNSFSNVNQMINASIHGDQNQSTKRDHSLDTSDLPSIALQPRKKQDDRPSSQSANAASDISTPTSTPVISATITHLDFSNGTPSFRPLAKAHFQPVNSNTLATSTQPDKQSTSMNTPDVGLSLASSVLVTKEHDTAKDA